MQAVKWAGAKLQGDKNASFCREMEWSRSYKETNQHPSPSWNFITHGFLDPSAFPDFCLRAILQKMPITYSRNSSFRLMDMQVRPSLQTWACQGKIGQKLGNFCPTFLSVCQPLHQHLKHGPPCTDPPKQPQRSVVGK